MTAGGSHTIEQYYKEHGHSEVGGVVSNPRHWNNALNESIIPEKYGVKMSQTEWRRKLQELEAEFKTKRGE
jgi:hypothetical protein